MANAKFKLYGLDSDDNSKLMATENHPKIDASQDDMGDALSALAGLKGYTADKIVLNSDTTVYTAE